MKNLNKGENLKIEQVYEKYKHLDILLSDEQLIEGNFITYICHELWKAIKVDVEEREARER